MSAPIDPPRPSETTRAQTPSISGDGDETVTATPAAGGSGATDFGPPTAAGEVGTLGPYRVQKELGHGGMGAVYAALDPRLDRRLALKVMLPKFAADASAKDRFLREARMAARITHDNIVTVYEADERDGIPYIAMQYLEGHSLEEYLGKTDKPTVAQTLQIAAETAAGLAAAHRIGLVHRDIKPANLWVEASTGRVKVLDFGLAKPVDADVGLTKSGVVVGTPSYMSPEQANDEHVDHRTDLFSLGAVLYRLCTGRLPFAGTTTLAVLNALATKEPPPVRGINPGVSEPLAALIHDLLAKDPVKRPQSADEVLRRVRAIADGKTAPRLPVRRGWWVAAGLAAFAALVMGGIIIVIKSKDGTETKIEVPDGATVTVVTKDVKTPAPVPPAVNQPAGASDPDRAAAEYALSVGGIVRVNGDDGDIKAAAGLPKDRFTVTGLNLQRLAAGTDAGVAHFDGLKGLTYLNLDGTKVTDAGLAHFKDCKGLTVLVLGGTAVTDTGLAHLKDCTGLTDVNLALTAVTDAGLAHLKDCRRLKSLTLIFTKVTDAGLARLDGCNGLIFLDLVGTKVTDMGLAHFKDCTGLTDVRLGDTVVTDAGLAHLKNCKGLARLHLRNTKVTVAGLARFKGLSYLDLSGVAVTDGDLAQLKDFTGLTALDLGYTAVTDAGLSHLKNCKELTILGVRKTIVTRKALAGC